MSHLPHTVRAAVLTALALLLASPMAGQDGNILLPVDSIERLLADAPFEIIDKRGSRFDGDRTSRAALTFDDGTVIAAKWAMAPVGADAFNNSPRHEAAAYRVQKLFLDEPELVVPPTVIRAFPLHWYRELNQRAAPTFRNGNAVIVTLQYWLAYVAPDDFWDSDRFAADTAYARNLANFNILTYLIRHNDSNVGNYLISQNPTSPRVFSVDNGLAFMSEASDRGTEWRALRIRRLPAHTVERLRAITEADLVRELETVAQFAVGPGGELEPMAPTANLSPRRGVRQSAAYVQLGLTSREIQGVWSRIQRLLRDVDRGRIELF